MKCEFCEKVLPEGAVSCPYCGSVVRNIMSDKGHTVISIEQQNDIGSYKMSSDYKAPEENNSNEDIFYAGNVSNQKFAVQKFTSSDSFKPKNTNSGNVVIGENGLAKGASLSNENTFAKNEISKKILQSSAAKKCEFCGKELPEGAASCPDCGSMVRRVMSDKGNTVISLKQQNDIVNYKMKSEYKTPEVELTEEEIRYGSDMSHAKFAQQNFTSENYTAVASSRDVVLRENDAGRTSNPNKGTYTMQKETTGQAAEEYRPKKKFSLFEGKFMSKKYVNNYVPMYGNEYEAQNQQVMLNANRLEEAAEVPQGLSKDQFMKLNYLHNVRVPFFSAIVILYICMVGMLFTSVMSAVLISNPYDILNIPIVLGLTYGMQFRYNYHCALCTLLFGVIHSFIGTFFYSDFLGFPIAIAGLLAVLSTKKFNELWENYQSTGTVPYTRKR